MPAPHSVHSRTPGVTGPAGAEVAGSSELGGSGVAEDSVGVDVSDVVVAEESGAGPPAVTRTPASVLVHADTKAQTSEAITMSAIRPRCMRRCYGRQRRDRRQPSPRSLTGCA
jgi:hypothetical protein